MVNRRLLLVCEDLSSNSVGRTYCLWLLATHLGYDAQIVSFKGSAGIWKPLAGGDFADACTLLTVDPDDSFWRSPDLILACKPLPESLGKVWQIPRSSRAPVGLDVDDPDLEYRISVDEPLKQLGKSLLRPRKTLEFRRLRRLARRLPTTVSNPWLQDRYGGTIIPHVRTDPGAGRPHTSTTPQIAFIGSNKPHKGVPTLREAVARLQQEGFTLLVTDTAPADAHPWEEWTGPTSLDEGLRLLGKADIAVIASSDRADARGQLPAKLMDAMLAGRAVVVSDVPAAPWGLAGAGRVVSADDVAEITDALREYTSPAVRQQAGEAAREVALQRYTVDSAAEAFARFCDRAIAAGR